MLKSLHNHLVRELDNCKRIEIAFINWASLIFVGTIIMNSITGTSIGSDNILSKVIFSFGIIMTFIIYLIITIGVYMNNQKENQINESLLNIYVDNKIEKYITNIIGIKNIRPKFIVTIFLILCYLLIQQLFHY